MTEVTTDSWLEWKRDLADPQVMLPESSVDAHCHVFGPGAEFPFAPSRKYTPGDASKADLEKLHQHLGFDRRVIVQASCHGRDNSALLDALDHFGNSARGVVALGPDVSHEELMAMHERGVRGVRFNFVKRLVQSQPIGELQEVAEKIRDLGWHIVLYFEPQDLPELESSFSVLGVPLVIDHMGRPDVGKGVDSQEFAEFLRFIERTQAWVKISCPERLTKVGPFAVDDAEAIYEDVAPFARRVLDEFGNRALWGTDWPHPNLKSHMPDDAVMLNYLSQITESDRDLTQLLVDNPDALYWTGEIQ
ncbi:amidohydrolase family protein [Brevibacterium oceani]|uniref:amidohydrolase family protein n=1 Tax=Brevibacterium oceani TaxID=358099 RepID=UPI001FECA9DC|nr:amidohydrolase family protein [Brevibacterium oceani]